MWRIVLLSMIATFIFFFYKYSTAPLSTLPPKYPSHNDQVIDIQPPRHDQHGYSTAPLATLPPKYPSHNDQVVDVQPPRHDQHGYMLSLAFRDQGTGSFVNLMCLRCFASAIGGVHVVEPFVFGSRIGLNLSVSNWTKELRFSDLFDSRATESFAMKKKYSDMVPFEKFLNNAPRKLLVVQHKCFPCSITCGHEKALKMGEKFARIYEFQVVDHICLEYAKSGKTTIRDIEKQMYKEYNKSEVTVMFTYYGGIQRGSYNPKSVFRMYISLPSACYRDYKMMYPAIRPSYSVRKSADYYVERYLHNKKYISVMIRIERVIKPNAKKNSKKQVKTCLDYLLQHLKHIKSETGIKDVFMCVDVGKYGSDTNSKSTMNATSTVYDSFLSQAVSDGMTLAELDSRFTNTTLIDKPGFVAMMQKTIAARGDVLVLLGGHSSNFQKSALEYYNSMHKKPKVYKLGESCK